MRHRSPLVSFKEVFFDNTFVAGFFVAEDFNRDGRISYVTESGNPFCGLNGEPPCELLDYHELHQ